MSRYALVTIGLILLGALSLAGCGSSPSTSGSGVPPPVVSSPATQQPAAQNTTPASTGSVAATFTYSDSTGDSETQTYAFGSPAAESSLPSVAQAAGGCEGPDNSSSENIAIPVSIVTTLNSNISVNASIVLQADPMSQGSEPVAPVEVFVFDTSQGYTCIAEGDANGTSISFSLTPGAPDDLSAWVILNGAISPDYPDGNPDQIGVSGIAPQVNPGFSSTATVSITASGPAVCTNTSLAYTPAVHIGGTSYAWQDCNRHYSSDQ